jgi:hypothetical protein
MLHFNGFPTSGDGGSGIAVFSIFQLIPIGKKDKVF